MTCERELNGYLFAERRLTVPLSDRLASTVARLQIESQVIHGSIFPEPTGKIEQAQDSSLQASLESILSDPTGKFEVAEGSRLKSSSHGSIFLEPTGKIETPSGLKSPSKSRIDFLGAHLENRSCPRTRITSEYQIDFPRALWQNRTFPCLVINRQGAEAAPRVEEEAEEVEIGFKVNAQAQGPHYPTTLTNLR